MGEQFWPVLCRAFHYALIAAHIVFIGSAPRLAEDVVRLVPVFPSATREGVSSVPTPKHWGWGVWFAKFMHSSGKSLLEGSHGRRAMIRFVAVVFALAVATSAQAATPVAPLHQPDNMITQ